MCAGWEVHAASSCALAVGEAVTPGVQDVADMLQGSPLYLRYSWVSCWMWYLHSPNATTVRWTTYWGSGVGRDGTGSPLVHGEPIHRHHLNTLSPMAGLVGQLSGEGFHGLAQDHVQSMGRNPRPERGGQGHNDGRKVLV